MRNIQSVTDSYLCSNCGACSAICGKDAISFKYSNIGRMYAEVNSAKCVDCGLCMKVCPSLDHYNLRDKYEDRFIGEAKSVYVGKSLNSEYFKNGQSGGLAATILSYLFEIGVIDAAIVCRMEYGSIPEVKAVVITSKNEILSCQKSCYTPVALLSALKLAKNREALAIVGLPCHIQGVEALKLTSKKINNIKYTIGLICERTLCNSFIDVIKSYTPFKDKFKIDWKRKDFSYDGVSYSYEFAPVAVYQEDGNTVVFPNYYRHQLKELFTPPRCRVCYDKINIHADIVLGDPWRMKDIDKQHGNSLIIARTDIGNELINDLIKENKISCIESTLQEASIGQLVEERKKQVAVYSEALITLPKTIESYLYNQKNTVIDSVDLEAAKALLMAFVHNEKLTKNQIINKAHRIVRKTKIRLSILGRLFDKVIGLFR